MSVLIVTVPHTGTMYLYAKALELGLVWETLGGGSADVYFCHLCEENMQAIRDFDGRVVTTQRDKRLIKRSWKKDGDSFGFSLDESWECFQEVKKTALVVKLNGDQTDLTELNKLWL